MPTPVQLESQQALQRDQRAPKTTHKPTSAWISEPKEEVELGSKAAITMTVGPPSTGRAAIRSTAFGAAVRGVEIKEATNVAEVAEVPVMMGRGKDHTRVSMIRSHGETTSRTAVGRVRMTDSTAAVRVTTRVGIREVDAVAKNK